MEIDVTGKRGYLKKTTTFISDVPACPDRNDREEKSMGYQLRLMSKITITQYECVL